MQSPSDWALPAHSATDVGAQAAVQSHGHAAPADPSASATGSSTTSAPESRSQRPLLRDDLERRDVPGSGELEQLGWPPGRWALRRTPRRCRPKPKSDWEMARRAVAMVSVSTASSSDTLSGTWIEHLPGVAHQHVLGHAAVAGEAVGVGEAVHAEVRHGRGGSRSSGRSCREARPPPGRRRQSPRRPHPVLLMTPTFSCPGTSGAGMACPRSRCAGRCRRCRTGEILTTASPGPAFGTRPLDDARASGRPRRATLSRCLLFRYSPARDDGNLMVAPPSSQMSPSMVSIHQASSTKKSRSRTYLSYT